MQLYDAAAERVWRFIRAAQLVRDALDKDTIGAFNSASVCKVKGCSGKMVAIRFGKKGGAYRPVLGMHPRAEKDAMGIAGLIAVAHGILSIGKHMVEAALEGTEEEADVVLSADAFQQRLADTLMTESALDTEALRLCKLFDLFEQIDPPELHAAIEKPDDSEGLWFTLQGLSCQALS